MATAAPPQTPTIERIQVKVRRSRQDQIFRVIARVAGGLTLGIMALIFLSLLIRSSGAIRIVGLGKFLSTQDWYPTFGRFGIGSVLFNTCVVSLVGLAIAFPLSLGAALFLSEYCPRRLRRGLTSLVDLLAAVPSIIFGVWGVFFLEPREIPLSHWLTTHLGFIPIFHTTAPEYAGSAFIAGSVLALMICPIATSVMREVFAQAPLGEREAALALGGSRWAMVRTVVLPFGRRGIIGGTMLALGRALGETIAVALIISTIFYRSIEILQSGTNTIAAMIVLLYPESNGLAINALMAAGLALFLLTLVVNALAAVITSRSRSGSVTEI